MIGSTSGPTSTPSPATLTWRHVVGFAIGSLVGPALLFAAAGRLDWPAGWAYSAVILATIVGSRIAVARVHPDLLRERGRTAERRNAKGWDEVLMPLVALLGPILIMVVAGLDERFTWSGVASTAEIVAGLVVVALGGVFASWAMVENRYFSATVRIQDDRGHSVVSTGPYAIVRHPGYLGGLIAYLGTGLALGSYWALLPALLTLAGIAARTALEDRTLRAELPGYEEYASRVRYRLLPGVW